MGTLYYHDFVVNFPRHGVVNYGVEFIHALPKKCNYVLILEPFRNPREVFTEEGEEVVTYVAAYRKVQDAPFMSLEEFAALPGLRNIFGQYGLYRRVVRYASRTCAYTALNTDCFDQHMTHALLRSIVHSACIPVFIDCVETIADIHHLSIDNIAKNNASELLIITSILCKL